MFNRWFKLIHWLSPLVARPGSILQTRIRHLHLVNATPIAETEPEKPEIESVIPDTVVYNPKTGAVVNTMNWLGKLTSEESKRVALLNNHYKSFTVAELINLYHILTYRHNSLTSREAIKRS